MNLGKVGIVFDGGGCKAAYSLGIYKALWEAGISPVYVQGVSAGALNATGIAQANGDPFFAERSWRNIEEFGPGHFFSRKEIVKRVWAANSLVSHAALKKVIASLDRQAIVSSSLRVDVVVTNETLGDTQIINLQSERVVADSKLVDKILLASCSIAGFLPPVTIDDEVYSDGITFKLKALLDSGCDTIFFLLNEPEHLNLDKAHNKWWQQRLFEGFGNVSSMLTASKIKQFKYINQKLSLKDKIVAWVAGLGGLVKKVIGQDLAKLLLNGSSESVKPKQIFVLRPTERRNTLWTLDFARGDIVAAIDHGYQVGKEFLENLK